jgi:hypothetical protein
MRQNSSSRNQLVVKYGIQRDGPWIFSIYIPFSMGERIPEFLLKQGEGEMLKYVKLMR